MGHDRATGDRGDGDTRGRSEEAHERWAGELACPERLPMDHAFHLADALDDLQILIGREASLDIARQYEAYRLHFCATGVAQTPAAERLSELKCIHEEWTTRFQALDWSDLDLTRGVAQTLADLELLIREAEQDGGV